MQHGPLRLCIKNERFSDRVGKALVTFLRVAKIALLLRFFERYLTELFHQFGQFQRSFTRTRPGSFVPFFALQSSVFLKVRNLSGDLFEQLFHNDVWLSFRGQK